MRKISLALTICVLGLINFPANAAKELEDNSKAENFDKINSEETVITNKPKATKPETISGAFGFTLGSFFDTKAPGVTYDAKNKAYRVKPPKPYRQWFGYSVNVTPISRKIYSIKAYFKTPDKAEFDAEKEIIFRLMTNKYYHGIKQNFKDYEFYYQSSNRNVDIFCCTLKDGNHWMGVSYIDFDLAYSEDNELPKKEAKDRDEDSL